MSHAPAVWGAPEPIYVGVHKRLGHVQLRGDLSRCTPAPAPVGVLKLRRVLTAALSGPLFSVCRVLKDTLHDHLRALTAALLKDTLEPTTKLQALA